MRGQVADTRSLGREWLALALLCGVSLLGTAMVSAGGMRVLVQLGVVWSFLLAAMARGRPSPGERRSEINWILLTTAVVGLASWAFFGVLAVIDGTRVVNARGTERGLGLDELREWMEHLPHRGDPFDAIGPTLFGVTLIAAAGLGFRSPTPETT